MLRFDETKKKQKKNFKGAKKPITTRDIDADNIIISK